MFYCNNCRQTFEEPEEERTTYEHYYGVSGMFPNSTPLTLDVCPCCGSDDIEEVYEDDEEEDEESEDDIA